MAYHHVIPQFHLRNFLDPESRSIAPPREPYLWVVDLEKQTVKPRSARKVAGISGYYDWTRLTPDEASPHSIEKLYSTIESKAAPVIRRLIADDLTISDADKFYVAHFVACQLSRLPRIRDSLAQSLFNAHLTALQEMAQNSETFDAEFAKLTKRPLAAGETYDHVRQAVVDGTGVLEVNPDHVLQGTLIMLERLLKPLFFMRLVVIRAPKERVFLTADLPVALQSRDGRPRDWDFDGWRNAGNQVYFPIAPRRALLFAGANQPFTAGVQQVIQAKERDVKISNVYLISRAERHIYCSLRIQAEWALRQCWEEAGV